MRQIFHRPFLIASEQQYLICTRQYAPDPSLAIPAARHREFVAIPGTGSKCHMKD